MNVEIEMMGIVKCKRYSAMRVCDASLCQGKKLVTETGVEIPMEPCPWYKGVVKDNGKWYVMCDREEK